MTYGPTNPTAAPNRSRTSDARRGNLDAYRSWSELWFIGYLVIFGLLGGMYIINHIFGWGGMIANTFIFMVYAMILAPVLTAPSVGTAVTIAGLLGRNVPQAFKTYLGGIAPNIAFWSMLTVGAMAWFPWHLGAWWAGPLVMAVSLFLVVHTWKYVSDAKIVKTLSLWYAIGVLIVGLTFALGADKLVVGAVERINPPAAFSQDTIATNWSMDLATGEEFRNFSPAECTETARGHCVNPDTGERLIAFDAATQRQIINSNRQRSDNASTRLQPALIFPVVDQNGCTGRYAMQVNCKRVTLHASAGDSIDWVVDKSVDSRLRCIQFNPSSRLQTSLLRNESDEPVGTTFTFIGNGQMTYTIFEVPVGQTGPGGARCGS